MKRFYLIGLLAVSAAWASNPGTSAVMEFYTTGPDCYADGSAVLAGETYLFVYVPAGSVFGGVDTAGNLTAADNKIVGRAAAWLDPATGFVRCPFRSVGYSTAECPAGGSFRIVLLDTRKNASTPGGHADRYSAGAEAASSSPGTLGAAGASTGTNAFSSASAGGSAVSLLDAATDTPVFTGIAADAAGGTVVTLGNLRAKGSYTLQESAGLDGWRNAAVDKVQDAEGAVSVTVPAAKGAAVRFFKVFAK